ncbi:MAG TPA: iron-sulfur cluster assembly scaffold protein [Anaerolineaceae bacterium]|nr:iron-sulfur cluster assembly scaffold protein [Anaerolineaceae bacterium]
MTDLTKKDKNIKISNTPIENQWTFFSASEEEKKPLVQSDFLEDEHENAFSEVAKELIRNKVNMGCFEHPDGCAKFTGWCDDTMQFQLLLDGEIIKDIRFTTDGCGATIVCGSMLTKMAISKTLSDVMKITPDDLLEKLVSIPEDHEHCLSLAVYTLRLTIEDAQKKNKHSE